MKGQRTVILGYVGSVSEEDSELVLGAFNSAADVSVDRDEGKEIDITANRSSHCISCGALWSEHIGPIGYIKLVEEDGAQYCSLFCMACSNAYTLEEIASRVIDEDGEIEIQEVT